MKRPLYVHLFNRVSSNLRSYPPSFASTTNNNSSISATHWHKCCCSCITTQHLTRMTSHSFHSYSSLCSSSSSITCSSSGSATTLYKKKHNQHHHHHQHHQQKTMSLVQHLNAIDEAIRQNNEQAVTFTYHSMKLSGYVPDLPCFKSLILFYGGRQSPSMIMQIYRDYLEMHCHSSSNDLYAAALSLAAPMQLGPTLLTSLLICDDWKQAELVFSDCMDRVLRYTNELVNNKQENMYQDISDQTLREQQEVKIIEQFLNEFFRVLVSKMLQSQTHLKTYLTDCYSVAPSCYNNIEETNNNDNDSNSSNSSNNNCAMNSCREDHFHIVHKKKPLSMLNNDQVLKSVYLGNIIQGLSLAIDIITRAQLYETENFTICLDATCLQSFTDIISDTHRFLKANFLPPFHNVNFYNLNEEQQRNLYCQDVRLIFKHKVQKKMMQISGYIDRRRREQQMRSEVNISNKSTIMSSSSIEVCSNGNDQSSRNMLLNPSQQEQLLQYLQTSGLNGNVLLQKMLLLEWAAKLPESSCDLGSKQDNDKGNLLFKFDDDLIAEQDFW